ncbi:hypothetical protein Bca4012_006847 [Brassica carinata]
MCIQSNIQAQRRCDLCINRVWQVTSVVEARLLRFWEARNVKRGGELMWVDMLLVDVNINRRYDKRFGQTPRRLSVKKQMKLNC